eukprot:1159406-Pelagomonas_calceolata.AAC.6
MTPHLRSSSRETSCQLAGMQGQYSKLQQQQQQEREKVIKVASGKDQRGPQAAIKTEQMSVEGGEHGGNKGAWLVRGCIRIFVHVQAACSNVAGSRVAAGSSTAPAFRGVQDSNPMLYRSNCPAARTAPACFPLAAFALSICVLLLNQQLELTGLYLAAAATPHSLGIPRSFPFPAIDAPQALWRLISALTR